jgi:hypothetical protein
MNPILNLLIQSKEYVALYEKQWNDEKLREQLSPTQKQYFEQLKLIIPDLEKLNEEVSKSEVTSPVDAKSAAPDFNDLYMKCFAQMDNFTSVQQHNISALLKSNRIVEKLQKLYSRIAPETIQRQKSIIEPKKKAIDRWASKVSANLQSEDTKVGMEKHFLKLLDIGNAAMAKKGMDNVPLT